MLRYKAKLKAEVFAAYGGFCWCCHEANPKFLTIDHVEGNGKAHRKQVSSGFGGYHFYLWLRKNDYPSGFQILCWNCNAGRQINGGVCPHVEARLSSSGEHPSAAPLVVEKPVRLVVDAGVSV